ncbi:MAG: hypothetical protein IKC24_10480 [Oscillospiraceae bacterium]|nr:hypothetical protein [Oscillospiraceae bacterium]
MKKNKDLAVLLLTGAVMLSLALFAWFSPAKQYSDSERRALALFPALNSETVLDGSFTKDFETYSQDQFPLRESFRRLKALSVRYLFRQKSNNDIYVADGHVSKLEYPLQENMLDHAAGRFNHIYEMFLAGADVKTYFSIVPDKNYFLAEANGYPALDYKELVALMRSKTEQMTYVDLFYLLSQEDYYRTDTHWRQECIRDVAAELAAAMGAQHSGEFTEVTLDVPFYGVYTGQSALPLKPDALTYLTSDVLEAAKVQYLGDDGFWREGSIYDLAAAEGKDPYDLFLSGAEALITIENPLAETDKELVIFRDSFGSSITPLLLEGYAKITVVDIRYIQSDFIGAFLQFDEQDVLFLYSTMMLNSSTALK